MELEYCVKAFLQEWSFAPLVVFPGLPLQCHISPFRVFSWQSTLVLSLWTDPWGLSLCTQPPLAVGRCEHVSCFSAGKCHLAWSLWWIFSVLPSEHLSRCAPLWGSEIPLWPCLWVGRKLGKCVESFLPSQLPPWGAGLCPELLCLPFFVFIFCPTWFWDWFVFLEVWGPLPVFRCYVGIVPHADDFLIYLWGRRWSPCPIPSPSCRSSWAYS